MYTIKERVERLEERVERLENTVEELKREVEEGESSTTREVLLKVIERIEWEIGIDFRKEKKDLGWRPASD